MSLTSGTRLGPYEIQSALGAGGMGEVYGLEESDGTTDGAAVLVGAVADAGRYAA